MNSNSAAEENALFESRDDFEGFDVEFRGKQYRMFKPVNRGKRCPTWYVKFIHRKRNVFRSTGEVERTPAISKAKKIIAAVLDNDWTAFDKTALRENSHISPEDLRRRIASLVTNILNGEATDDAEMLDALERKARLPHRLRPYESAATFWSDVRSPGVYLLVKNKKVVYVGQSKSPVNRLAVHLRDPQKHFDDVYIIACEESALNWVERQLIAAFPDCDNDRNGNRGRAPELE